MTFISGQQSNCQFGKSTLRQKVWKFTVDNLTNGLSTGHPWCADIIKPDNITPISSAPIICGNNTILSGILTQHLDIYSPHSPHCKHYETHFRESVSQSHESQRIIKSFIRQWQEFVRFKDFSVTNSSQDSHRKFRSLLLTVRAKHESLAHVTSVPINCKTRWSLWEIQSAWTL